jgi:hypothetical protein
LTDINIGLPEPEERQLEVDAERLQWSGDPGNLCGFKDSLTVEQVRFQSRFMFKSCHLVASGHHESRREEASQGLSLPPLPLHYQGHCFPSFVSFFEPRPVYGAPVPVFFDGMIQVTIYGNSGVFMQNHCSARDMALGNLEFSFETLRTTS